MNKVWLYIIDIFVGILLMFIAVTVYFGIRTETVMQSMYDNAIGRFVAEVKKKGVITVKDYENFIERMGIGYTVYDIDFEHKYKILEPEYRLKTLEEIIDEQNKRYTGSNEYHYREVATERPHVNDPINDGNLNTETNESVIAKAKDTPADPNHVHDENCYEGHRHTGKPVFIHEHAHNALCVEFVSYVEIYSTCNTCKKRYQGGYADYYWDSESKSVKYNSADTTGTYVCPYCGSRNITNESPINYYQYSCGYDTVTGYKGSAERTPYGIVYQYEKSYPQNITVSYTQISGCYQYHITKELSDSYEYSEIRGSVIESSAESSFQRMMYTDYFEGYCHIPRYIRVGISSEYHYESKSLSDLPDLCYITYEAYLNSNKQIRFRFINYMYSNYFNLPVTGSNNPGFPTDLTVYELADLASSLSRIKNYFYNFFGSTYIDRLTAYKLHIHWFKGVYVGLTLTDGTEYINVCSFDHSLGVNTWLTACGYSEDGTADCDKIIVSIVPTHPTQTVYINDPLIITAVVTFKNGATKTVVCTTDFTTANVVKDQNVTLTYNYSVEGKNFSKTCYITVTVIPRNKTCPKGHTYNLNNDGIDPGCPYCRAWVESLQVIRPATSPIVITIGTSLQENGVTLLATYMDGHTEEVTSGYTDNLDKNYFGTMQVTIGYKGATVTVLVTTVRAKIRCDICGYEYELYPDGTNPGCPKCIQKIPVFTGNIMEYEQINHTEEIINTLYDRGEYIFNIDDIFTVSVKNKSSNIGRMILKKIYPSLSDHWFWIRKSEYILNR